MDRISKHDVSSLDMDPAPPYIQQPMLLAEPEDAVELGDRLLAFWHIYWHDKVFCILLGFLPALPHDDTIDSVFPREVEEYETVESSLASNAAFQKRPDTALFPLLPQGNVYLSRNETIAGFLARQGDEALLSQSSHRDSLFTTQLKAVTLLGRATRLTQKLRSRESGFPIPGLNGLSKSLAGGPSHIGGIPNLEHFILCRVFLFRSDRARGSRQDQERTT